MPVARYRDAFGRVVRNASPAPASSLAVGSRVDFLRRVVMPYRCAPWLCGRPYWRVAAIAAARPDALHACHAGRRWTAPCKRTRCCDCQRTWMVRLVIARLPPLTAAERSCQLPLSEPTAGALLAAMVAPSDPRIVESLAEALALDPALALWCVLQRAARESVPANDLATIKSLSNWLAKRLPQVVKLGAGDPQASSSQAPVPDGNPTALAELAAADVAAAELVASTLDPATDPYYLGGLLTGFRRWLELAGYAMFRASLPDWIAITPSSPKLERALSGTHDRCEWARSRWLVPVGVAKQFPFLAGRLARLIDLETDFSARLEEEKLAALAEFAAGAGHEINNPLAVISGRAQLFLRHERDPGRRRELAIINAQARRVYEMIADLMLFARPPQPALAEFNVAELVASIAQELSPRAAEAGVELAADRAARPAGAIGRRHAIASRAPRGLRKRARRCLCRRPRRNLRSAVRSARIARGGLRGRHGSRQWAGH